MTNIETQLIVEAISKGFDKVVSDTKRVDSAIDNSGKTAGTASNRYTELVSKLGVVQQAYGAVAGVVKFAADAINKGADLQLAQAQFDNLTKSIGATSESMMTDLKAASQGMVSDAELMAGASQIISLGLANTQEDTVRLATAVSTLGLDMQQVILTFANNSKARLDSLGLSIADVDRLTKEFTASGMDANKAFDQAVLVALENKMALLGNTADTTAGSIAKLQAHQENLTNAFNQFMAVQWEPILGGLVNTIDATTESTEKGRSTFTNAAITMNEFLRTVNPTAAALNDQWIAQRKVNEETAKATTDTASFDKALMSNNQALIRANQYSDSLGLSYAKQNSQTRELTLSIMQQAAAYGDTMAMANQYADANKTTSAQIFEATKAENQRRLAMEASAAAEAELTAGTLQFFNALDSSTLKEYQSILGATTTTSVLVAGRTEEQEEALVKLQNQYEKAQETVNEYVYGVKGLNLTDEERNQKIVEQQELMGQLQGAMQPLLAIQSEYATVTSGGTINQQLLNEKIFESIQAHTDSAAAVAIAGQALGIYTEEEANARLQSALLDEQIRRQIEAWDGTAAGIENVKANIQNYINELNSIPSEINTTVTTNYVETGAVGGPRTGAGAGVGSGSPQAFASGGWTGNAGGIVHPNELVIPSNIINQGMGAVSSFANAHVPGGVPGGGGGYTYNITVNGGGNPAETRRAVEAALRQKGTNAQNMRRMR